MYLGRTFKVLCYLELVGSPGIQFSSILQLTDTTTTHNYITTTTHHSNTIATTIATPISVTVKP